VLDQPDWWGADERREFMKHLKAALDLLSLAEEMNAANVTACDVKPWHFGRTKSDDSFR